MKFKTLNARGHVVTFKTLKVSDPPGNKPRDYYMVYATRADLRLPPVPRRAVVCRLQPTGHRVDLTSHPLTGRRSQVRLHYQVTQNQVRLCNTGARREMCARPGYRGSPDEARASHGTGTGQPTGTEVPVPVPSALRSRHVPHRHTAPRAANHSCAAPSPQHPTACGARSGAGTGTGPGTGAGTGPKA